MLSNCEVLSILYFSHDKIRVPTPRKIRRSHEANKNIGNGQIFSWFKKAKTLGVLNQTIVELFRATRVFCVGLRSSVLLFLPQWAVVSLGQLF